MWAKSLPLAAALIPAALLLLDNQSRVRVPGLARQVASSTATRHGPVRWGLEWGLQLGTGVLTVVNSWGFWALLMTFGLLADPVFGSALGAIFGLTRGIQPALAMLASSKRRRPWLGIAAHQLDARMHFGFGVVGICLTTGSTSLMALT
jgi:hypothetical protein